MIFLKLILKLVNKWYLPFYLCFVFALAERKHETQKEDNVPLRKSTSEPPRTTYQ